MVYDTEYQFASYIYYDESSDELVNFDLYGAFVGNVYSNDCSLIVAYASSTAYTATHLLLKFK